MLMNLILLLFPLLSAALAPEENNDGEYLCVETHRDNEDPDLLLQMEEVGVEWADLGLSGGVLGAFILAFPPNTSAWAVSLISGFGMCGISGWTSNGFGSVSAPGILILLKTETSQSGEHLRLCWAQAEEAGTCRELSNLFNFLTQIDAVFASSAGPLAPYIDEVEDYLDFYECL